MKHCFRYKTRDPGCQCVHTGWMCMHGTWIDMDIKLHTYMYAIYTYIHIYLYYIYLHFYIPVYQYLKIVLKNQYYTYHRSIHACMLQCCILVYICIYMDEINCEKTACVIWNIYIYRPTQASIVTITYHAAVCMQASHQLG